MNTPIHQLVNDYIDRMMPGSKVTMVTLRDYAIKHAGRIETQNTVMTWVRECVCARQDVTVQRGMGVWKQP